MAKRRIKILHVIPGLEKDGAEYQMYLNVKHLDPERFESHVAHLFPRTELAGDLEAAGATIHSVVATGKLGFFKRIRMLVRLIKELDIDIVHGSNVMGELYGAIAGKIARRRVLATLTNISYADADVWLQDNPYVNRRKLTIVNMWRKFVLRRLHDRYIAISKYVKDSAIRGFKLKSESIDTIYRGLPIDAVAVDEADNREFREQLLRDTFGDADAFPLILNVGRLVAQKGQRYLIEAMPQLLEEFPKARLVIAGEGPLEQSLKELVEELGVADSVRFLGRRQDVRQLLGAADIFAFPSLFEGFGVALLEACFAGKPCVVTDRAPLSEIVIDGESGLLVEPGSSDSVADGLLRLCRDSQLREKVSAGARERAQAEFKIEVAVDRLSQVYGEMVAQ